MTHQGSERAPRCAICDKHDGEGLLAGPIVHHDEQIVVSHRPAPIGELTEPGYLFVETRRHVAGLAMLSEAEAIAVARAVRNASRALEHELDPQFVFSAIVGRSVAHFHQHVFVMGPVSDLSARLLACDARLAGVGVDLDGAPVSVTPSERLFTGAARRVVIVRDRCCIKCGAPASWCDVHHVIHHADGGPTTVDNGCLLCRSCHTSVHHAGWQVVMGVDRHPWLIPPASVDPHRRPLPSHNRRTMRLDMPSAA